MVLISGLMAMRTGYLNSRVRSATPLARAVTTYCLRSSSSSLAKLHGASANSGENRPVTLLPSWVNARYITTRASRTPGTEMPRPGRARSGRVPGAPPEQPTGSQPTTSLSRAGSCMPPVAPGTVPRVEVTVHAACRAGAEDRKLRGRGRRRTHFAVVAVVHRLDAGQSLESQSSSAMMTVSAVAGFAVTFGDHRVVDRVAAPIVSWPRLRFDGSMMTCHDDSLRSGRLAVAATSQPPVAATLAGGRNGRRVRA